MAQCLPVPTWAGGGLTDIEAASLPETYFTVWSNVFDRVRLQAGETLNAFMASGPAHWQALRHGLFALLKVDAAPAQQQVVARCLMPQADVEHALPARIGDYTDFYTSIHHARNVGRIARPDAPLTPNFQWIPIAYHGRFITGLNDTRDFQTRKV